MYTKPEFAPASQTEIFDFIDNVTFGALVTNGPEGLVISHLIFLVDRGHGPNGTLMSHLAAANPHGALLEAGLASAVIFEGPHGYISSSWYPAAPVRDSAPTWNFSTVHVHGAPVVVDQKAMIRHLYDVVAHMERGREKAWQMQELGPGGMARRLPNVLAFEIPIERLEAKFKMGQDERARDTGAAIAALRAEGDAPLADMMAAKNPGIAVPGED